MAQPFKRIKAALSDESTRFGMEVGAPTALIGAAALGPVGLLLGGMQGILGKRLKKGELDRVAEDQNALQGMNRDIGSMLERASNYKGATPLDQEQLAVLQNRREMIARDITSQDPHKRTAAASALQQLNTDTGAWFEDIEGAMETERNAQRGFVTTGIEASHRKGVELFENVNSLRSTGNELNRLLNDPGFDPENKAIDRARANQLIAANARAMYADPAGMDDALRGAGMVGGVAGALAQFAAGLMDANEFKATKDDYRRVATAAYDESLRRYKDGSQQLAQESKLWSGAAAQVGAVPEGFDVSTYILGEPQDADNPYQRTYPAAPPNAKLTQLDQSTSGPARNLAPSGSGAPSADTRTFPQRVIDRAKSLPGEASGEAGLARSQPFDVPAKPEEQPRFLRDLFDRLERTYPAGTQYRFDEESGGGGLFAVMPDGSAERVNAPMRDEARIAEFMKQQKAQRESVKRGVIQR